MSQSSSATVVPAGSAALAAKQQRLAHLESDLLKFEVAKIATGAILREIQRRGPVPGRRGLRVPRLRRLRLLLLRPLGHRGARGGPPHRGRRHRAAAGGRRGRPPERPPQPLAGARVVRPDQRHGRGDGRADLAEGAHRQPGPQDQPRRPDHGRVPEGVRHQGADRRRQGAPPGHLPRPPRLQEHRRPDARPRPGQPALHLGACGAGLAPGGPGGERGGALLPAQPAGAAPASGGRRDRAGPDSPRT